MRRRTFKILLTLLSLAALQLPAGAQRERVSLDREWRFALGHAGDPQRDFGCGTEYFNYFTKANSIHNEGPYTIRFKEDSTVWRGVDLPYDFVVDLPFAEEASYSHGHKTVGWRYPESSVGWYRKTFRLPESDRGRHFRLQFDGIFRDAQVWVNGVLVGSEPSGYTHQDYDITPYLLFGNGDDKENLVCVRADATFEEGWFYEGAGIYRHVWLEKSAPVHVATDGVFVRAEWGNNVESVTVHIETETLNDSHRRIDGYSVEHDIVAPDGQIAARLQANGPALMPTACGKTVATTTLSRPQLWSLEAPQLYRVVTRVKEDGQTIDELTVTTGFRKVEMDKDRGLLLNGKPVKLKGFNNHQDHAGVGSAIPDGLQAYRIRRMKDFGANAYRASHNPMTSEALAACDSLGMLVFEENRLLGINDFQMNVAANMVRHDRNHPCVILWGIGNEEWGLEWDERSVDIAKTMTERLHLLDPTRPVAAASSSGPKIIKGTDVAGYNYILQHPVEQHRANYPERVACGSEETTGCGTRGVYFNEKDGIFDGTHPNEKEGELLATANPSGRVPSRNLYADKDSTLNRIERGWKFYDERPWLLGLFYWTGFDYRGEPVPLNYPATGSQFGVFDYCGFPKDEAYYLLAWWKPEEPMLHLFPHWNLQGHEGETVNVWAYSNCDEVELSVNGKSAGRCAMPKNGHLSWPVVYQPGRIEAVGYRNGKEVARERIETTGEAAKVDIREYRYADVMVADLSVLDHKGRLVPTACIPLTVTVSDATFLGWGNGDPAFTATEHPATPDARSMSIRTFNGRAQVIVRSDGHPCRLTATMAKE